MTFGLRRAKMLGYLFGQLVSKIFNLCGHDPPTSQTDRRTDGQTTCDRKTVLCTVVHRAVKTTVFTRDSIYAIARICHSNSVCPSVCLSVCLSVTRVDQSKMVEARITQFFGGKSVAVLRWGQGGTGPPKFFQGNLGLTFPHVNRLR